MKMSSAPCGSPDPQSPPVSEPDESAQVTPPPPQQQQQQHPAPPPSAEHVVNEDRDDRPPEDEDGEGKKEDPDKGAEDREDRDEEAKSDCSTIKDSSESAARVPARPPGRTPSALPRPTAADKPAEKAVAQRRHPGVAPKSPMKKATPLSASRKTTPMMRINQQPSLHQSFLQPPFCRQESFGEGIKTGPSGSDNDSDSEISDAEHFLAKGAFLLTPSHDLSLEKASAICEKMSFNAPFSLTKTATGILFKFARPEDFQATFKKGFHKVTNARFYKKIPIPCRPQKTFTVYVLEVPEEVPEEDIRHALYKFHSVVEVVRLAGTGGPQQLTVQKDSSPSGAAKVEKAVGSMASGSTVELGSAGPPPLIRITLANLDEFHALLQNGLDFYGATFFPTESGTPSGLPGGLPGGLVRAPGGRKPAGNRILDVVTASGQRVRDLLPVFDAAGFSKIPPPAMKTIKPRGN